MWCVPLGIRCGDVWYFCVALIVCIALCSVTDNHDVMLARVLTPAPVVVSCLSLSHRSSSSRQADLMTELKKHERI